MLTSHESGIYYYDIPEDWIQMAKQMRKERDKLYANIYMEYGSDKRWIGELGELTFNAWLKNNNIESEWIIETPAGKSDFLINQLQVDVKTVKRQGPPKAEYTAQISAKHKDHPGDDLFFLSYEFPVNRMWFLGGIKKSKFLTLAKYFGEGEQVHSSYIIRKGHEILNIEIGQLITPDNWLSGIK